MESLISGPVLPNNVYLFFLSEIVSASGIDTEPHVSSNYFPKTLHPIMSSSCHLQADGIKLEMGRMKSRKTKYAVDCTILIIVSALRYYCKRRNKSNERWLSSLTKTESTIQYNTVFCQWSDELYVSVNEEVPRWQEHRARQTPSELTCQPGRSEHVGFENPLHATVDSSGLELRCWKPMAVRHITEIRVSAGYVVSVVSGMISFTVLTKFDFKNAFSWHCACLLGVSVSFMTAKLSYSSVQLHYNRCTDVLQW